MNGTRTRRTAVRRFGRLRNKRVSHACGHLVEAETFVEAAIRHDLRHQRRVHGVPGALGDDVAQQRTADERKVADQVQRLVTAAFVGKAEATGILHVAVVTETDGVVQGGATNEAHLTHLLQIALEAEGARGGKLASVAVGRDFEVDALSADQRVWVEDIAGEQEPIGGKNRDPFIAVLDGNRPANAQVLPAPAAGLQARAAQQYHPGLAAAVEDGHLEIVDLDVNVVDAHTVEHAQQMLGGGDKDTLAHQAGGIADTCDIAPDSWHFEPLQVGANKNDAGAGRRGDDPHVDGNSVVQPGTADLNGTLDGGLESHIVSFGAHQTLACG